MLRRIQTKETITQEKIIEYDYIQILITLSKSESEIIRKFSFLIICLFTFYGKKFTDLLKLISSPLLNSLVQNYIFNNEYCK